MRTTLKSASHWLLLGLLLSLFSLDKAAAQFRIDSWTTDTGLPQASINDILQTRDGFIWLTTFGGLVRYDGLRFQVFNTGNTEGLKTSRFLHLYEDKEGSLWITTERQGVTRYRDGVFKTFSREDGLPNNLFHISEGKDGNLLFVSYEGDNAAFRFEGAKFLPLVPGAGQDILSRTSRGNWSCRDGHLRKFANGQVTVDFATGFQISRCYEDSQGQLWIAGAEKGAYVFRDGQLTPVLGDYPLQRVDAITEDRDRRIWFAASQSGLVALENGKYTAYSIADGLAGNVIQLIYQDREGTIWVGTTAGLSRLTKRVVTSYSVESGLAAENVYPICEDRAGRIWIGSWMGLTIYENNAFQNVGKRFGLAGTRITSLLEDREGNLWIGKLDGIARITNGQVRSYSQQELPDAGSRVIVQDRAGNVWFGTQHGLIKFRDEHFTHLTAPEQLGERQIFALYEDRKNNLWIGTDAGLAVLKDGAFRMFSESEGIKNAIVRSITEDTDGALWIGMYDSGLYRFKDGRFTHYTTNEGLFDNGAFQILEDNRGNFWISCNLGIYRVKKSELNDFAEGRIKKITSVPYNKRDGMLNSECNGGAQPAGIRAQDGRMWFPTQKGVAVINPEAVPFNREPPPVVVESVIVDATPVEVRAEIRLQPGQTYLEIHYSGLSFINPELVKFKYKLEGSDKNWIEADTRRVAYYTHLPPGKYRFRVLAANRDGVWNEEGTWLAITVLPHIWQTWWFLVSAAVLLAAAGYFIYRHRIRILKRAHHAQEVFSRKLIESQEAERKRIAAGLHDNLGQHLIIIKNWATLGLNFTDQSAPVREQLDEISTTAVQALNEVREIIYDLRPYQLETIGLSRTIESMVEQVAASSGIDFKFECDEVDNLLSSDDEVTFYRMIQECVSNVVKHSHAERAGVQIKREGNGLEAKVSDNGRGFVRGFVNGPQQQPDKLAGFGLTGLYERVQMLGGTHEVQSILGKGTTVVIRIRAEGE